MKPSRRIAEKIGVFGGTFDPPHVGHLIIAESAREQLGLSRVIFVPAAHAPHKRGRGTTAPLHRLTMTRLAVRGHRGFRASDVEVRRGGVSYTVDTLRQLRRSHPKAALWLIVGSDNFREIYSWREPDALLQMCRLAVYRRPGFPISAAVRRRTAVVVLEGGSLDISATVIRALQGRTRSIRFLVPPAVESYLRKHRLYRPANRRSRP
jgi:nicotinate-nucleotide adenylyltransferase